MQGYTYSVFSIAAVVIHLIINFDLLTGRKMVSVRGAGYRGFLTAVLAYYITDALWGILAGLGWSILLYVDTIFFFLSLVGFAFMWCRFVISYLALGRWPARILSWAGYALWAFNLAMLALNPWNKCFFHIDAAGDYHTGWARDPAFHLLVAFNLLMAVFVFVKALRSRESVRRRSMMVFVFCVTMAAAEILQVIWPLTPFTALGCLVGNCFLHVFIIEDEQTAKHMTELVTALERARTAEKARSTFFSIVSHDIRTPLNAILGYSELLQGGIADPAEREEALRAIRASGTTLLELVNDVLDLAKMDSGKMTLHPEPVLLSSLTDEVFSSFRLAASERDVELVNKTAGVPEILLDEHRFRQILFNLIGNAVKFTEKGSVTVTASYVGKALELAVSDTGCGIPRDMLTRILEPFVQVGDASHAADRAGGTGLGLSICSRLVKVMGGEFSVESEVGKGSTFMIRIPGVGLPPEGMRPTAPTGPAARAELPRRVLVVDDSPVNRAVLTAFLKKAGVFFIDHAGDGAEALTALDAAAKAGNFPDLVLTDLWMPNMNGLEFIEKLRADGRFGHLPVFAVTADTEFRRDTRTCLFTGVLLKPLTYDKLVDTFSAAAHAAETR